MNNIKITSEFIPWSKSRNYPKWKSLNWKVTLHKDDRPILTTEYSAGIANCPSYRQGRMTQIDYEIENGYRAVGFRGKRLEPNHDDVLRSLLLDADVLNCSSFEEWASDFDYDTDSRKAEAMYRQCLQTALALRNGLGEELMRELQEKYRD